MDENTVNDNEINETPAEPKKKSIGREIWEWVYTIAIALALVLVIKGFAFEFVRVDGLSMSPTLDNEDRLVVTKFGYKPEAGDIIILDSTYARREQYYDNLAEAEGKDELNAIEKLAESFSLPDNCKPRYYVKRVIALPGQTIDIKGGKVYIDDELLEEEYYDGNTFATDSLVQYPLTVAEDCVFVMGDNRHNSTDSRNSALGLVPYDAIVGKSQVRVWPLNSIGLTR